MVLSFHMTHPELNNMLSCVVTQYHHLLWTFTNLALGVSEKRWQFQIGAVFFSVETPLDFRWTISYTRWNEWHCKRKGLFWICSLELHMIFVWSKIQYVGSTVNALLANLLSACHWTLPRFFFNLFNLFNLDF